MYTHGCKYLVWGQSLPCSTHEPYPWGWPYPLLMPGVFHNFATKIYICSRKYQYVKRYATSENSWLEWPVHTLSFARSPRSSHAMLQCVLEASFYPVDFWLPHLITYRLLNFQLPFIIHRVPTQRSWGVMGTQMLLPWLFDTALLVPLVGFKW